ncbi:MAG: 50S ribosomal protein L24 [Candidatus Yanofskybacteria bacterium RIFCSPHIGHO2_02_FULL_41_29]|uniref:Large ribosomal subunit protein uL24 n=1 Tax=Candidatus Yanofskybacteria bacterium RIFCSPHIGHO2_01_FULL_41_53 TaxID=1802663 RepID=A0A1F8EHN3_9BACT|nr:MAG: 50S ribosomal protein L24 [Candidatus Yanofskybacteria bacterium RIFCSPHIGHO2_01_FULL_41_53]OGN11591.1 MAG: 50S ribosomal protein L24 [Candidatus Yanofskybacteria bacterium RIFCSPHIGHO2_02_FULL_41_29]OGN18189.1 MAG: 50S ribosomal protein L24 [Candidatus Yanofskybacteria bacterium RIFCSPHIGHO2_12_FULL_41_9]OGN22828.1 MAG: 50S ribosomal protein L24 [Candidatus Yanofskybacteria bacterium RIFCSPLOWO2_01_FULL_41_67]OGN30095.1 MAG: 50S ribosomal protein L24 [Candidatus Yanofskybacteria bacter
MKIKKNDNVIMLSGKDRGRKGKITHVFFTRRSLGIGGRDGNTVVVEGLNLVKKHLRAKKQGQKGQIVSKERAVNASSVALVCKSCGKQTRLGYKVEGENKIRICKKCGAEV